MLTMTLQSALEKIFLNDRELPPPYPRGSGLGGERFAFQAVLDWDGWGSLPVTVTVDSPLKDHIRLYRVGQVPCQLPAYPAACDEDYLTTRPGLFPDPLFPLEDGAVEVEFSGLEVSAYQKRFKEEYGPVMFTAKAAGIKLVNGPRKSA